VDIQFNEKYISELPVLNRNFTNFELLSPGTQKTSRLEPRGDGEPTGRRPDFRQWPALFGHELRMDGTDNQDPILGIIVVNQNLDAIGEAKVALQGLRCGIGQGDCWYRQSSDEVGFE